MSGTTAVDVNDVSEWKTSTHFLLRDIELNKRHTFQLVVLFELRSQSPIISKPAKFELVPRGFEFYEKEWLKQGKELIAYTNKDLSYVPEMTYCEESEEEEEEWVKRSHSVQCSATISSIT
ncbi:hypothetical protein CHS0354_025799 [Potamilus streckersoni]|uniref:Uncharacterized protein n=1 Tax=Potamilus streckersoni TaxID=2493646 RepID=A0AAE0TBU4_9BIVA|nr:hypothetical protein CHS0354_025799 [Potamilus streckersoni]